MDPILNAIDLALKKKGLSDAAASIQAVGNPSLIKNMRLRREGEKRYSIPALEKLGEVLGLELYFGPPKMLPVGFSEPATASDLGRVDAYRAGYFPIPWHDLARRPGSSPMAFSRDWVEANALLPDHLRAVVPQVIHVPGIPLSGAVAVIDVSPHHYRRSGLSAFKRLNQVHLGYLTFARDLAVISSSDPSQGSTIVFPDDEAPVRPLGRVVWVSHLVDA